MTPESKRHRAAHQNPPRRRRRLLTPRTLAAVAIGGVLLPIGAVAATSGPALDGQATVASPIADDEVPVSRDADRLPLSEVDDAVTAAADQAEKAAEKAKKVRATRRALEQAQQDPRGVAQKMVADFGWDANQFSCLDALWVGESGWDYMATNPSSGAYGIPQSLPGSKMATAGKDWETNPTTQIRWGLDYIRASYGAPCAAQSFKSGHGFY